MDIILFGPPGVGKSTLIGILKSKGFRAIDLEDLYPNSIRFQIPNVVKDTFIGAADLNPARKYNAYKVLLFSEQKTYEQRRHSRDAKVPGKASQMVHSMSDWLKGANYDLVLDTTSLSPARTAQKLIALSKSLFKEQSKGGKSNAN